VPGTGRDWYETVQDVAIAPRGRVIVAGQFAPPRIVEGRAGWSGVVQASSPAGSVLWTRAFRDGDPSDSDLTSAVTTVGRSIVVAGPVDENRRAWVARLNGRGRVRWERLEDVVGLRWVVDVDPLPGGGIVVGWRERRPDGITMLVTALDLGGKRAWRSIASTVPEGGSHVAFESLAASGSGISVAATWYHSYRADVARVVRYAFPPG
jgi:hypothetical protein